MQVFEYQRFELWEVTYETLLKNFQRSRKIVLKVFGLQGFGLQRVYCMRFFFCMSAKTVTLKSTFIPINWN